MSGECRQVTQAGPDRREFTSRTDIEGERNGTDYYRHHRVSVIAVFG